MLYRIIDFLKIVEISRFFQNLKSIYENSDFNNNTLYRKKIK